MYLKSFIYPKGSTHYIILWILIAILVLIIILAVVAIFMRKKYNRAMDYYNLFIIGIIWLPIGIALNNTVLWILGFIFTAVGLANRDKWKSNRMTWKKRSKEEKILISIISTVLFILGIAAFVIFLLGYF